MTVSPTASVARRGDYEGAAGKAVLKQRDRARRHPAETRARIPTRPLPSH